MPFPKPAINVRRGSVGTRVKAMLLNLAVGDVQCTEQADGLYTILPRPRSGGLSMLAGGQVPEAPKPRSKSRKKRSRSKAK